MSDQVINAIITIVFGAVAGGLTNTVAIWMLFHPYEPPKLGRWTVGLLHGAVPKNQGRLAAAIGRTVGTKLLTEGDLTEMFADKEIRAAFDQRLSGFLDEIFHVERGSLREMIPAANLAGIESLVSQSADYGVDRLLEFVRSDDLAEFAETKAQELLDAISEEPVGELLTPAREVAITDALDEWIAEAVEQEGLQRAVEQYLERASVRLLEPERTFEDVLPLGLVGSMEKAIAGYLPLAITRLGTLLEDKAARARFEATLHDLFQRFLQDLKFHQRVVARLVMTEETVDNVLNAIEEDGAQRLSEMLQDQTVQDAMARGINEAIVDFLRRPVTSVLGGVDDPAVTDAQATLAGWVVGMVRDPSTRTFVMEKLDQALERASERTWGQVLKRVPTEKVADWLVQGARSELAEKILREGAVRIVDAIMDQPIGKPAEWLPAEAPERIETALSDPIWGWLQTQIPEVVQKIDVAGRVEQKVIDFPTPKLEELVRKVTDRELKLIVRLGYLLGAIIGSALVGLELLRGG